jgi:hypothetical protein
MIVLLYVVNFNIFEKLAEEGFMSEKTLFLRAFLLRGEGCTSKYYIIAP